MFQFIVLGTAVVLSFFLNRILIRFSHRFVFPKADSAAQERWAKSKPLVGGQAFFILFLLGLLAGFQLGVFPAAAGQTNLLWALMSAGTLGFLIGLADDAYSTNPLAKFLGQVGCGVLFLVFGVQIHLFGHPAADGLLTLLWVVGIMNSINMLDNMDGITGSVSTGILITATIALAVAAAPAAGFVFLGIVMIGALLGFLLLNWNPSKLFMGDTGSMFIGVFLAFYGILAFWNYETTGGEHIFSQQLAMVLLAFLVPILDTSFVTVARLRRGQSPFVGGRDHTTHHLAYNGLSDRLVAFTMLALTLLSGSLVVAFTLFLDGWQHLYTTLALGYTLINAGAFYALYQRGAKIMALKQAAETPLPTPAEATDKGTDKETEQPLHQPAAEREPAMAPR